ncbi:MAG TPA: DUF1365 domain-containing protein [Solirubrobacteraceae bacterium]|jgi:DUF1365 family protein|nr:DUF1365 domain-containing protein [Solirubrobacteraceae bacterium]
MSVSAIYEGTVRHRRFAVRSHEFRQRLALAYLDLEELPALLGGRLLRGGAGLARFRREDYLGDARVPLASAVRDTVEQRGGARPSGPVRLLANLSAFGHCFNPVSFYYCMSPSGEQVDAVVAEVTNTPWGERHSYVLRRVAQAGDIGRRAGGGAERQAAGAEPLAGHTLAADLEKTLHVSPFMGMDHRYRWRMTAPAQTLSVHISSSREGRLAFDATLSLRRRELTAPSLARLALSTSRTLLSIYRQAAILKLKGVPVHPHPGSLPS